MLCLQIFRKLFCGSYILALSGLIAATKQNDDFAPLSGKVHPKPRAVINAEFRDTISYRFGIAEVSGGNAADAGGTYRLGDPIFLRPHPFSKGLCFPYRHNNMVSRRIRLIKRL
jgi:hypothetical protein